MAFTAIWRAIATGDFFHDSHEMVEFLNSIYSSNQNPSHKIKEIDQEQLERARVDSKL